MTSTYDALQFALPDVSIVIPAYNEAERIGATLASIADYVEEQGLHAEVVVVDDGSTDDTAQVVDDFRPGFVNLRVLRCERNGGKGRAVRLGMLVANGRTRLFMDADNSTDIREFERLTIAAREAATMPDIVIASIAADGCDVEIGQSLPRELLGRLGSAIIERTVLPGIKDSQRGFKVFTAAAADAIFPRCRINGWGFDVEVLAIGRALGFHILEVPVRWRHTPGSRVGPTAYFTTLMDVARTRRSMRRLGTDSGEDAYPSDGLWVG
jgi:dolichyl-phosphate beta-glucosyltransferase